MFSNGAIQIEFMSPSMRVSSNPYSSRLYMTTLCMIISDSLRVEISNRAQRKAPGRSDQPPMIVPVVMLDLVH